MADNRSAAKLSPSEEKLAKPIADLDPPYRVLSMDGGGIYGTFTAIMLRKLCERDEKFLVDDQITMFAGTSAGAINALLLAKHENPRDAIQERVLERFFTDARVYSNQMNPIAGALSLVGLTSWSGKADFYAILEDYFGDMKMKDLKHRVMITAFDLAGAPEEVFGQYQWKPKMFYNFPGDEPDRELYVKDVAYGAASPPTLRPVRNGITDGGFFASDPSTFAIAKIVSKTREHKHEAVEHFHRICEAFNEKQPTQSRIAHLLTQQGREVVSDCLSRMLLASSEILISQDDKRCLEKLQGDLKAAKEYDKLWREVGSSYEKLRDVLDFAHKGMIYLPEQRLAKVGYAAIEAIVEFAGHAEPLARWEHEFWVVLTGVMSKANLPEHVMLQAIEPSKRVLQLIDSKLDELKEKCEGAKSKLDKLQMAPEESTTSKEAAVESPDLQDLRKSLQDLELLRDLLFDTLAPQHPEDLLGHISVLSLGVGAMIPNYFLTDFDFGFVPFNLLPTNPTQKSFSSPLMSFAMNPAKDATRFEAKQLLGANGYFRLDPPVIGFPVPTVINAAYLARFNVWRQFILKQIYQIADSKRVAEQITKAEAWMRGKDWIPRLRPGADSRAGPVSDFTTRAS